MTAHPEDARPAAARVDVRVGMEEVWRRFAHDLRRWFELRAAGGLDADELLQETLVRLTTGLPGLTDTDRLAGYVWTTARHALIDARRASNARPVSGAELDNAVLEPATDPADRGAETELEVASWLAGFVAELPAGDREVLSLADLEGLPHAEVAQRLGIGVKATRSRLHRARRRLRERLTACCEIELDTRGGVAGHRKRGDGEC